MTEEYPTERDQYFRAEDFGPVEFTFEAKLRELVDKIDKLNELYEKINNTKDYIHKDNNAEITKRYFELNPDAESKILEKYKAEFSNKLFEQIDQQIMNKGAKYSFEQRDAIFDIELIIRKLLEELK